MTEYMVSPLKVRELPDFIRTIKPLMAYLAGGDIRAMLLDEPEALINAIVIGSRVPLEQVQEMQVDELVQLTGQVIEVNLDFFITRVMPEVNRFTDRVNSNSVWQNL